MLSFLTLDAFLRHLLSFICLISLYGNAKNFFRLAAAIERGTSKDFDVFYIPILFINICLCLSVFAFVAINQNKVVRGQGCNESVAIFISSVLGGCHFQIGINWLEVTSKSPLYDHELKVFEIPYLCNAIFSIFSYIKCQM